ncbi:hypothetical protein ACEYW6_30145 [Nostoc sp. UIC 10607]
MFINNIDILIITNSAISVLLLAWSVQSAIADELALTDGMAR